ncbi:MAG: glutamate--tRNA ligase [Bacteroidetes bacterium]|nr:glutamate--tRNA ligase [Bacteroidota bacterium]
MTNQDHHQDLISSIFPQDISTPEELEHKYPKRDLPEGAVVTRFAPSPTGFVHIGGIYTAQIAKNLTRHSGGVFIIRIEDTDQSRQVDDFQQHFNEAFDYFDVQSDEDDENAMRGPYTQSKRSHLYLTFVKQLIETNHAYPCFCSKEKLTEQSEKQRAAKVDMGYYGEWATCRHLEPDEANKRIQSGESYVIRFRANPQPEFIVFNDLIRGSIRAKNNMNDIVILKSSSSALPLPTYHLAHAVDDHLMGVNLVLRGEEWLASVPVHLQLFDALGFERIPYAHVAPLMKLDGNSKRKLSKRKDPEASVAFYMEQGYPPLAVTIYLKGLANSDMIDMDQQSCLAAPIRLKKMSKSGALLDMDKLNDISSDYIAALSATEIRDSVYEWAQKYNEKLSVVLKNNWEYAAKVIDVDRFNNGKVRKDLTKWSDFDEVFGFFFKDHFKLTTKVDDERFDSMDPAVIKKVLLEFTNSFKEGLDSTDWFEFLKGVSSGSGFALNNKEYKQDPEGYNGKLSDATKIMRVAFTGKGRGPSLHEICDTLGEEEIKRRVAGLLG